MGATEWHIQEARALSAIVKRPPSFVEWLVANKARHEREAEIADRIREQRQRYEDRKTREREEERQRIEQRLAATPEQLERSASLDGPRR